MANLAGFDLILEVPRAAIEREIFYSPRETLPDGRVVDTFVPPFMMRETVPLPGGVTALLQVVVEVFQVQSVPRTSRLNLHLEFAKGSLELPATPAVSMVGGRMDLSVPLLFTQPAGPELRSQFAADFGAANVSFSLDQNSQQRLQQSLGPRAQLVEDTLRTLIADQFRALGLRTFGFSFVVNGNSDSSTIMTLTAVPMVYWIDSETLGFFGYHRRGATTGDLNRKTDSDLPKAPYPSFPWYPVAVLLSPDGFQRTIACPGIRAATRDQVAGPIRDQFLNEEKAKNNNQGAPTQSEIDAANARLNQFLASPAGQAAIAGATPAPCGSGQLAEKVKMPDPFPDTTAYTYFLSMTLGSGQIDLLAKSRAEVFCGSVDVTLPMHVKPSVNRFNQTIDLGPVYKGQPDPRVRSDIICDVAIGTLLSFILGPFVGSVATVVSVAVAESIAESLMAEEILKKQGKTPQFQDALPPQVEWHEIVINPTALMLHGYWSRVVSDPHRFEPSVKLDWERVVSPSLTVPTTTGTFTDTCLRERAVFAYTRRAWDTIFRLRIKEQDAPHPLQFGPWMIGINGAMTRIVNAAMTFGVQAVFPEPPLEGHIEFLEEATIQASGSDATGWELVFRAEHGTFPVWIETTVRDGSGKEWYLYDRIYSQGQTLEFGPDYGEFRGRCRKSLIGLISRYQWVREPKPWEPIITPDKYVYENVRDAVAGREFGATHRLLAILAENEELSKALIVQIDQIG